MSDNWPKESFALTLLQFFASIVHSIAWPLSAVFLGLVFRKPLARLIPALRRARYKDLEFNFGEALRSLEQQAVELEVAPSTASRATKPVEPTHAADEIKVQLDQAETLAQDYPEPAVLVAWDVVEAELYRTAARKSLVTPNDSRINATKLVHSLREHDVISASTADFLTRLRNLRNVAEHPGGIQISTDEAREYTYIARDVAYKLRAIQ
jgi:hypothetical protein